MRAVAWALDFLFPPRCPACAQHVERVGLCAALSRRRSRRRARRCARPAARAFPAADRIIAAAAVSSRPPHFERARACALYPSDGHSPLIDALHRFKYGRDVTLAPVLGAFLADHCPLPGRPRPRRPGAIGPRAPALARLQPGCRAVACPGGAATTAVAPVGPAALPRHTAAGRTRRGRPAAQHGGSLRGARPRRGARSNAFCWSTTS